MKNDNFFPFRNEHVYLREQDEIVYGYIFFQLHNFFELNLAQTRLLYIRFGRNSQSHDNKITEVKKRNNINYVTWVVRCTTDVKSRFFRYQKNNIFLRRQLVSDGDVQFCIGRNKFGGVGKNVHSTAFLELFLRTHP